MEEQTLNIEDAVCPLPPDVHELWCVIGQRHKRALSHISGQMRVANHPQRGGIDEVNVPLHEFGERRIGSAFGVILQQLSVS